MNLYSFNPVTFAASFIFFALSSHGEELKKTQPPSEIVCSYAPSQSKAVLAMSGVAGGAAATTAGLGSALGLSAVLHSSGGLILSGSSGYIAGTLGTAIAGPVVLAVGAVIGGTAVTVELFCAPINHPDGSKKVMEAAKAFEQRTGNWVQNAKDGIQSGTVKATKYGAIKMTSLSDTVDSLYRKVFANSVPANSVATPPFNPNVNSSAVPAK